MNREQRRRAARQAKGADLARQLAAVYQCPDCNAETHLVEGRDGVHVFQVAHDGTCPAYRAMTKEPDQ